MPNDAGDVVPERQTQRSRVFISYSRTDLVFADQLVAALEPCGFEPSIDRHEITGGEEWRRRLRTLIANSETVVFVLSPASAKSDMCGWEVQEADAASKRLIPVLCRPLEAIPPPQRLKDLDYIYFYPEANVPGSGFGSGLARLVKALNTDLDWIRQHTRLMARAAEWDEAKRADNRLLSGSDIDEAKDWLAGRPKAAPEIADGQRDFISASERAQTLRLSAERKRTVELQRAVRRFGLALICASILAIGATTAGIYAYWKQQEESLLRNKAEAVLDDIATNLIPVWADDEQSPDYKHLSEWSRLPNTGNGFTISPAVIAMLIVSNEFAPTALDGKIVVALRGCSFAPPQFLHERPSLELFGTRPDHAHPDAVVIVYDMVNSVLSGFDGSSVPSSEALQQTVIPEIHTAIGLPVEHSARCNLLPTGLFHYRVGSHNGRPGVLVQYQQIAVRRTYTNLTYEVKDPWDVTYVFDDLYPSSAAFYSYGSLTISEGDGQNHAPWASFRAALGLTGEGQEEDGKRVDVLLVTGLDAEIAAEFLNARFGSPQERSEDRDRYLVRLRQGSRGEHVKKLQAALRLPQTGEFDGMTAKGLADLQTTKLGWSDGIYSPEMDQQLGLCVYERPDCR